ncbi:ornithine cyclodeaminase family protein [Tianweitania sp.]|uniref:ornithine cyclodeaminase family protein n=1 Tax=Tianweitania sp. TaxID=2021634 RepID=UPI00289F73A8|nr:ornithine cyclodeaminase family protein [Tianweitania sp.]
MLIIGPEAVDRALSYEGLIEVLRTAFHDGAVQPVRHHHTVERPDGADATLLLMPAWSDLKAVGTSENGHIGIKIVTVSPDNNAINKPAVMGNYLLLDAATGEPQALIDGQKITVWRTACASALAASYLAREDVKTHLIVGAGALSVHLAKAHRAVRPLGRVLVWNRTAANAAKVVEQLQADGFEAEVAEDLDAAQAQADVISCATLSTVPLVKGALLKPGTHVDLVGAFTPAMRESDDEAIVRARVYVDTKAGATKEAGDIVQALQSGALSEGAIVGDLFDLTRGTAKGRQSADEITLFKSVGAALEDLAAAIAVYRSQA